MDEKLRRSRKQEKDGARRYGGTVNSQSGAGDIRKNDVRTKTESIEFKGTTAQSYRLTVADLIKAWRHAMMDDRTMIFGIEFFPTETRTFSPGVPTRYVVMTEDDYLAMRGRCCGEGCTGYGCDFCNGFTWADIQLEIKKCDLVCSNCHRQRTWGRS